MSDWGGGNPGRENKPVNAVEDFPDNPICGVLVVIGNEFPDFVDVGVRLGMKDVPRSYRTVPALCLGFLHQAPVGFLTINRLHASAFQIIVAPIHRLPRVNQLVKKAHHCVFQQFVAAASGVSRHLIKLRLHVWGKMHFH
jgi:hypothetical protein